MKSTKTFLGKTLPASLPTMKKLLPAFVFLLLVVEANAQGTASYYTNADFVAGSYNSAFGKYSMYLNETGNFNTAAGAYSLYNGTSRSYCTAIGYKALYVEGNYFNGGGAYNSALGYYSLYYTSEGRLNTAIGQKSLFYNSEGSQNVGIGYQALYDNLEALNIGVGIQALANNTFGSGNIALGMSALSSNTTGSDNYAIGANALSANTSGQGNTAIGTGANVGGGTLNYSVALGAGAIANASGKMRIGKTTITKITGQRVFSALADQRFMFDILAGGAGGSEFIMKLRPVVYNFDTRAFQNFLTQEYPDELRAKYMSEDFGPSTAIRHSGFIAQEVEKTANETSSDFSGIYKPSHSLDNYALSYDLFVVPLVKTIQEQQKQIAELKTLLETLTAQRSGR